ncbi:MAG TPA: efflux RND transporter periplasmic adaptor subunit [Chitinispirillaceae bacterium]|nr:efflux RND transporter periplasmic adaptor subunit [Chitinispirillaceae bacterium]
MQKTVLLIGIIFISMTLVTGCRETLHSAVEKHKGTSDIKHDEYHGENAEEHAEEHAEEKAEEKAEHDHNTGHSLAHDEGAEEIIVAAEFIEMAGITLAKVSKGKINKSINLSGEIGFDEERVVHITPRFAGIVKEAKYKVGEYVNSGDVLASIESNQSMTHYSIKAPMSGRIIQKHAVTGEHVSEQESIYVLADLSKVWVNLALYPKDAEKIKVGQLAMISAVGSDIRSEGLIQYITPVMDTQTRKITARVVLVNRNDMWRPGLFVNANIAVDAGREELVIDKNAVQILNNKQVVFIQHEPNAFKPIEVVVGECDYKKIHVVSGLEDGMEYVNNGAFELKAKVITSSLGEHAGHGH